MRAQKRPYVLRAAPVLLTAALMSSPLLSTNCAKKQERAAEESAASPVQNQAQEMRKSLSLFLRLRKNIKETHADILQEEERIGRLMKDLGPEEMLVLYRDVEKDLRWFDGRPRNEDKIGLIEMCTAGLAYADENGKMSKEAQLGSLLFALPFLPDMMGPHNPAQMKIYYQALSEEYIGLLGEKGSLDVQGWARGKEPFSDDSLLSLFERVAGGRRL